jgi:hypothetical protein
VSHRRLEYFVKNKIVYRQDPVNDLPTERYVWGDYYEDGTYECYSLFQSKAKINSNKSFAWHIMVLYYLNPSIDHNQLKSLANYIADKRNNFITFDIYESFLNKLVDDLYNNGIDEPPKNRTRKVIFKDTCGLTMNEKLSIVGSLIGRNKRVTPETIYDAMLFINDSGKKITINGIANMLGCAVRTIHRNINDSLKNEKAVLNNEYEKIQRNKLRPI